MDEYKIGDLIEATVILGGRERRELLSYQPDPGPDEDLFPWQRLERGERDDFTAYFSAEELADVKRLVTLPVLTRDEVITLLSNAYSPDTISGQVDAVMALIAGGKR